MTKSMPPYKSKATISNKERVTYLPLIDFYQNSEIFQQLKGKSRNKCEHHDRKWGGGNVFGKTKLSLSSN